VDSLGAAADYLLFINGFNDDIYNKMILNVLIIKILEKIFYDKEKKNSNSNRIKIITSRA
jgi:hypothetical protein